MIWGTELRKYWRANYLYMGMMINTQTALYHQEKSTGYLGTIYRDWERDDGWLGTVTYLNI